MNKYLLTIAFITVILTGCSSSEATLLIKSQPEGAYITEVGTNKSFGMAPVTFSYNSKKLLQHKNANGCYLVNGVTAKWISGAVTVLSQITLCGPSNGGYSITLQRNPKYPGMDKDMQFALKVKAIQAQQAQAKAAEYSAAAALMQNNNTTYYPKTTTCNSNKVGSSVYTNCY